MKKMLALMLVLSATSVFAVQPCGVICKNEVAPLYAQCISDFASCTEGQAACESARNTCFEYARQAQLDCVELCMGGEWQPGY